ncbi:DUF2780 domain-containing protein [Rhodopirellula sp. SWK7]|uniref:DUF2780 domain-containing protein n=1 Tax=Rhodopirellula sp. SWK7 TaxID=595460 RepID=UPI0002BFCBA5|nr:DUF2780 domain-containing protein [Rhodopirellula sp. SWK7]EMI42543.1 hypothetical protein RRSWK_04732 [Rhodopirellula sp. SWK7]
MDELIQLITGRLGIDSSIANAGVGKLMALLKDQVGGDLFNQIAGAVPGAEEAASQAAESPEPAAGGGLLGKLSGMASAALGGNAGGGLEMASALASTGIDADKLGPFISTVVEFLKDKLGDDVVEQIMSKLPMLKTLLG